MSQSTYDSDGSEFDISGFDEDDYEDEDSIPDSLCSELDTDDYLIIQNKETCIGYTFHYQETPTTAMEHRFIHRLMPTTFFRFATEKLEYYLEYYSFDWAYHYAPQQPRIRIVQIYHIYHRNTLEPEYLLVDKTFWIRLVQRTWKRKYAEKQRLQRARGSIQNQRHFEIYGRYLSGYNHIHLLPLF
jgi:hypothetical protein